MYPSPVHDTFKFPASPRMPSIPDQQQADFSQGIQQLASNGMNYALPVNADAQYWRNIFVDLGFGGGGANQSAVPQFPAHSNVRDTSYPDDQNIPGHMPYQHIPSTTHTNYLN